MALGDLLFGIGDGTFKPAVALTGFNDIQAIAAADFKRDAPWTWSPPWAAWTLPLTESKSCSATAMALSGSDRLQPPETSSIVWRLLM